MPPHKLASAGERHLRDFLEHSSYLIHSTDMQGRLLWVNETWKRALGYDDADLAAVLTIHQLVAPESSEEEVAKLSELFERRDQIGLQAIELTFLAKDGRRVAVAGECDCRIEDGVPVATRGIFRDVSVERAAESRARHVEAQHQAVVQVLDEGIAIVSADATVELINPSGERMLGLRAADIIGRSMLDWPWHMIDEDGGELPLEAHPALVTLHTREPQADVILGVRRADTGEPIWLAVNARPLIRARSRKPYAAVVSFRDVTAERAAAMALRARESRFRAVLETVSAIAVCLDTNGRITFANDHVLELTGYARDEVLGADWFAAFVPPDEAIAVRFREMIARGEMPEHHEHDIVTRSGERRRIRWDATILRDDEGVVIGTASLGHDVTEQVRVLRLKNELISMASHELRTPLTAIRGAIDLLRGNNAQRTERDQMLVSMVSRNTERLDRLVTDLMDVERIDSGIDVLKPTFIPVATLIASAVARTRGRVEQGSLVLALDAAPVELWVDGPRIEQVMVNLIGNAANYAPKGSTISVQVRDGDGETLVSVRDEGRGIAPDKLETIFEPFVKVDGGETKERGAGLGLFLCRAIVTQHGGRIWAESALGAGTLVTFTIPKPRTDGEQ
ncbi:MAG: PAS domain S-box protein [Gemmatimonadaceae bacterium]